MQAHQQSNTASRNPELRNPLSVFVPALQGGEPSSDPSTLPALSKAGGFGVHSVTACAALTHDAGNIFAALYLYCDLLEIPGVLAPQHRHYPAELRLLAERSCDLLRQAMAGSLAIAAGPPERPCDPVATLRALLPVLQGVALPAARVTLHAPASGALLHSDALPAQTLERIAVNLVRNAAQAIAAQPGRSPLRPGRILIALSEDAGLLRLAVQDDGPGLPMATAAALLQPQMLPVGATRGFGHRIVHELANASGGSLSVRVRPGRGSRISLHWPISRKGGSAPC